MASKKHILRGSAVLALNEVVSNGCALIRNYILARVLSKDDFGVAAILMVTFSFLEIITKMAFGQQIVSSRNGGDQPFVDTEHTIQLVVGLAGAGVFLILARPLAGLLAVPQLADGIRLLAFIPVCMAFGNLGAFTYARDLQFGPSVCIEAIPQVLITIAAWPVAVWLGDYRAFIWLQIGKAALSTLVSYVVGGRRYACHYRGDYCRQILRYSWPLVVSSFILICSSEGDRLLMTRTYTLKDLGMYAVAWWIAATPVLATLRVVGGTALPVLAKARDAYTVLRSRYALLSQALSLCGAVFALAMVIAGEPLVALLFGDKYTGAGLVAAWIACAQGVRLIRGAPINAAWARNETGSSMLGNVVRLSGLLLLIPVLVLKGPLWWVAIAGLIGEVLALFATAVAVHRLHRLEVRLCLGPTLLGAVCVGLGAAVAHWWMPNRNAALTATLVVSAWGLTLFAFSRIFGEFGQEIGRIRHALEARMRWWPAIPSHGVDCVPPGSKP